MPLAYYILKDNGIYLIPYITGDDTENTNDEETAETGNTEEEDTVCEVQTCDVDLDNEGWSLFSVPEYNLSIEVPTYTITQTLSSVEVDSIGKPGLVVQVKVSYLDNDYLGTIYTYFSPTYVPESSACGGICLGQHFIYINVYKNSDSSSLDSVISNYRANWEDEYVDGSGDITSDNLVGEITTKWNLDVWSFLLTHMVEHGMDIL